jgi:hypothetical protein
MLWPIMFQYGNFGFNWAALHLRIPLRTHTYVVDRIYILNFDFHTIRLLSDLRNVTIS